MEKLALFVLCSGFATSLFGFNTEAFASADSPESALSETINSPAASDDSANRQAEIETALKLAQQQFEARQKQIVQDVAKVQDCSQKHHEAIHNDFTTIQGQLDQAHNNFQNHFKEVNGRIQEDHDTVGNQWSQIQKKLDQARTDFN